MKILIFVLINFILISFISYSFASRPLSTDDAGTVEMGKYELEFGYDNCKLSDCSKYTNLTVSIKHGLTEKMDIGINLPYQIEPVYDEKFGSVTFGSKFGILKDILAITFSNVLGSYNYMFNSIFSANIGFINFNVNIGYNYNMNQDEKGKIAYALGLEHSLEKFDVVGEIFGTEGSQYWLLGLRYNFVEKLFIDIGYNGNFRDISNRITSGLHYEF